MSEDLFFWRKKKRARNSTTKWARWIEELMKSGLSPQGDLEESCKRNLRKLQV